MMKSARNVYDRHKAFYVYIRSFHTVERVSWIVLSAGLSDVLLEE